MPSTITWTLAPIAGVAVCIAYQPGPERFEEGQPFHIGFCTEPSECVSKNCIAGTCCDTPCDGPCDECDSADAFGLCRASPPGTAGKPSCAPYVCDGKGASCPTGCASDGDCATGYRCRDSVCVEGALDGGEPPGPGEELAPEARLGMAGWSCNATGRSGADLLWGAGVGLWLLRLPLLRARRQAARWAAIAALIGGPALAEAPSSGPPAPGPGLRFVVTGFRDAVSRQSGGECGVAYAFGPRLGAGAAAVFGRAAGGRAFVGLHPWGERAGEISPFVELSAVAHPTPEGLGAGIGAWLGASFDAGPGRVLAGMSGRLYRAPARYYPYGVFAQLGYQLDFGRLWSGWSPQPSQVVLGGQASGQAKAIVRASAPAGAGGPLEISVTPLWNGEAALAQSYPLTTGQLELELPPGAYRLEVRAPGHLVAARRVSARAGEVVTVEMILREAPEARAARLGEGRIDLLQPIEFAFEEARLLEDSTSTLDEVADILLRQPGIRVRIESHPGDAGSPESNRALAALRAAAVRDYLLERGVAEERVSAEGSQGGPPLEVGERRGRRIELTLLGQ
ncbi:MAG: OmpA family protein [Myxococcales bacterium]|nr:OmpA family protein [Myxococcales bacterium]